MLNIIIWVIIILLFLTSFAGIIFPIIPSPLGVWLGFLLYYFMISTEALSVVFWIAMVIFTIILIVSDIIANSYFVKRFGGSKWGERSAAVAVIAGSFIMPPFGVILVPFAAVLIVELIQKKSFKEAIIASIGSLIGFLSGSFAKVVILLIMIVWFFIAVFW